ncbi:translation initiation factor [Botrimarina sp.]|uniref:translation initiation factor n=1 Tax=Botrimarina sp. TaxID=2795802 RepID=UPI0032EE2242
MAGLFDGTPLERPVRCDRCGEESTQCQCPPALVHEPGTPPAEQTPRVRRERRRGKWCAVVSGVEGNPTALKELLSALKSELGCGGGVSDGELIFQGDCRDAVVAKLVDRGFKAKPGGG